MGDLARQRMGGVELISIEKNAMPRFAAFRKIHRYVGLLALLPLLVLSATGILLNHADRLGLKSVKYGKSKGEDQKAAGRTAAGFVADRKAWEECAADVERALSAAAEQWGRMPLEHIHIKNERGRGMVVKIKARGHLPPGNGPEELVWSVGERRWLSESGGGGNWLLDLHTGKIFSARFGFLWSDIVAGVLLALSASGLILYLLPIAKKRQRHSTTAEDSAT